MNVQYGILKEKELTKDKMEMENKNVIISFENKEEDTHKINTPKDVNIFTCPEDGKYALSIEEKGYHFNLKKDDLIFVYNQKE